MNHESWMNDHQERSSEGSGKKTKEYRRLAQKRAETPQGKALKTAVAKKEGRWGKNQLMPHIRTYLRQAAHSLGSHENAGRAPIKRKPGEKPF